MREISAIAQKLLQLTPDALLVVDKQGIIQFSNEASGSLFGYTIEQLVGRPIKLLIPERFHIRHRAHVSSYLREPSNREMGSRIRDLFAQRADGSEFPAGIRLAPFQDGDELFVAASIRDMTEHLTISDALIAAREVADRANRAKSRFLATASHDLRQPLQAVRMLNASMQKLTQHAPNLNELVCRQEQAIDSATRLLNALLDISRLESGTIEPELTAVSLADVFSDLEGEFEASAATKNLQLGFMNTQIVLSTDRMLFLQLLQNLIGNAVKYTESGYVRISHAIDADDVIVTVEDSGMGIAPDKVGHIFDEYYQVGLHSTQRLGVGLGLAIVREISRLLGYSIAVTSNLGDGTYFRVRIPRHRLLSESEALVPTRSNLLVPQPPSRCRVVLLDDNDSVRMATELFLSLEGFEIRSAVTAAEAEILMEDMRPNDVFITDYHLEGKLTGLDVLVRLRTVHNRDVPAILLSGDLQALKRVVKTSIKNCRFLDKPVDTKALLLAITELSAG